MWRSGLIVYFGLLALIVLLTTVTGQLDQPERELFDILSLLFVMALALVLTARARSQARTVRQPKSAANNALAVDGPLSQEAKESLSPHMDRTRHSIQVIVATVLAFAVIWACLIFLGTLGDDAQSVALINMQVATSFIAASATATLAVFGPRVHRSKVWLLRSAAIAIFFLQALGLTLIPLISMKLWNGFVDFPLYGRTITLIWLYPVLAAVVFCFLRTRQR